MNNDLISPKFKYFYLFFLLGILIALSGCDIQLNTCGENCPQVNSASASNTSSNSGGSVSGGNSVPTPASSQVVWLSNSLTDGNTIAGPAVVSGDFDVNEVTVKDGQAAIGTVIVLLDNAQYTFSGPNSGTRYYLTKGQPSLNAIALKVKQIVSDQRKYGCQGGCSQSKVVYFQNGKQQGSAQYQ